MVEKKFFFAFVHTQVTPLNKTQHGLENFLGLKTISLLYVCMNVLVLLFYIYINKIITGTWYMFNTLIILLVV